MLSAEMCVESASSMETSECNAKRGEQGTTTVSCNRIPKLEQAEASKAREVVERNVKKTQQQNRNERERQGAGGTGG